MKKQRFFNMIEVLLALAISAIGITGILGIIPLGLKANRDAMAETFAADIANSYFAGLDLDAAVASSFSSFVSNIGVHDPVSKSTESVDGNSVPVYKNPLTTLPARSAGPKNIAEDGVNFVNAGGGSYVQVTVGKAGSGVVPDFEADLCVWKCYPDDIPDVENSDTAGKQNLIRVYLEISWPVNAPYDKREKRIFVREFFNTRAALKEVED